MGGNREALTAAGEKIWNYTVTELSLALPFLRSAFFLLRPQMDLRIQNIGTDGSAVAYQPRYLLQCFVDLPPCLPCAGGCGGQGKLGPRGGCRGRVPRGLSG